jgi:malate dehydrogenase
MKRAKITIVGAGNVGANCAVWAAEKGLGDIVLIDIPDLGDRTKGRALDLAQCAPVDRFDCNIIGTSDYAAARDSDLVIITAGLPRKPGMSRDDLVQTNVKIVRAVSEQIKETAPEAILIVVSNPLDAMVYTAWQTTGFPTHRVVGQAGCLDIARFRTFIAMEVGCSVEDITSLLMGGHGDDMVPLPRYTSIAGVPVTQFISEERLNEIIQRAKMGGGEIVKLMGTSAYYAPSAGSIAMAEAIIKDKKRILPCAAYCDKEYGVGGYFVGVPCVLGEKGVEKVIEVDLNAEERKLFASSAQHVRELVALADKFLKE